MAQHCPECAALAKHVDHLAEALVKQVAATDKLLLAMQRARIPKYLTQARQYLENATTINMAYHTQAQVLIRVTMIVVVVGSAATLQIGDRTWPFNGFSTLYLGEEGLLIRPEDAIELTQTTEGAMGLEFYGEEMADRGQRW